MCGAFALRSEIARRIHQSASKMFQPKSIHQHARAQWMLPARQPSCVRQPTSRGAAAIRARKIQTCLCSACLQAFNFAWIDFLLWLVMVAAVKQKRLWNFAGALCHREDKRFFWFCGAEFGSFLLFRCHFFVCFRIVKIERA